MPADYLSTLADELLAAAESAVDEPRTGHALPDRRYVGVAQPPADCDQLVVFYDPDEPIEIRRRGDSTVPSPSDVCAVLPVGRLCVELWRSCWPTVSDGADSPVLPTADEIETATDGLLVDLWALTTGLLSEWAARTLFESVGACDDVEFESVVTLEPAGGLVGFRICLQVALNDLGPVDGS